MTAISEKKSFLNRAQLRLASARFFTFSALIHVLLIVTGGSVVLFKQAVTPPDFEAGGGELVSSDVTVEAPPEEPPKTVDAPKFEQTISAPSTTALDAITTTALTPSAFAVQSAPVVQTAMNHPDVSKTMDEALKRAGDLAKGKAGGATKPFGSQDKIVNSLVGTFYDLKQTRAKKPTNISTGDYHKMFRKFVLENWRESILSEYYKGPKPIYATQIFSPDMSASEGPKAFGVENEVQPSRWLVHYKGKVSPPQDGTYHFVGAGDDVLLVRFNGKLVLDRCWGQKDEILKPERNYDYGYTNIPNGFGRGSAMKVKAGQFYDIEILIGEEPGGYVNFAMLIEEEGAEYQKDKKGNPILPIFRLADGPPPDYEVGKEGVRAIPPFQPAGPVWKAAAVVGKNSTGFENMFGPK